MNTPKLKLNFTQHLLLALFLATVTSCAQETDTAPFIVSGPESVAGLIVSPAENELVHTAVTLFADDIFSVSSRRAKIKPAGDALFQIKIGTVGINPDFDRECIARGININGLKGKWETYLIKAVKDKKSNRQTLFIVGSQPRGTAYGLMELSQRIGVSPWYWWADVRPQKKTSISLPGNLFLTDGPGVQFRGIFINDEDWGIQPWAAKTFEPETGDIGPKTYAKVFELLLRLKANAVWPAMHPCTRGFFTYPDNIKMADRYGIYVGSSHCEPMLRNNVDEWHRWAPEEGKRGSWNFDKNPEQITDYWTRRVRETSQYDCIYTIGMRGIHDGGMPGGKTLDDKVRILDHVFDAQRKILSDATGKDVSQIPQLFCPYKEVLKLYKKGAQVPDYATIMWSDDNYGYIRQLSDSAEQKRPGGAGVYYHVSYFGRPHDYLWLGSTPVSLIWEEMNKAYQTNARKVWIVNVGDIKPNELDVDFFLNMAWNPEQYNPEELDRYYNKFAEKQFGKAHAELIGKILKDYFQLAFSRKPEHLGWNRVLHNTPVEDPKFSLFNNGDEVRQRINAYNRLEQLVDSLSPKMEERLKDAFFELVYYPVTASSKMNKKVLYAYMSREYAKQGRVTANKYARQAKEAFEQIRQETEKYNQAIANGKWNRIMSYHPRDLPVFDMPETGHVNPQMNINEGVIPEGYANPVAPNAENSSLPVFNSRTNRTYFIDVYNSGLQSLTWKAVADQPWVQLSDSGGQTATGERILVSVNWSLISSKDTVHAVIRLKVNNHAYPVHIDAIKQDPETPGENLFIEDNGMIAIEAEHFSHISQPSKASWKMIRGLGRTNDAMGAFPVTAPPFNPADLNEAPSLTYNFYAAASSDATLYFYCLPNQPINAGYQLRFAVRIDNGQPVVVNANLGKTMDEHNSEWQANVLRSAAIVTSRIRIPKEGKHELKITMIDPGVVLDKVEIAMDNVNLQNSYLGAPETLSKK